VKQLSAKLRASADADPFTLPVVPDRHADGPGVTRAAGSHSRYAADDLIPSTGDQAEAG